MAEEIASKSMSRESPATSQIAKPARLASAMNLPFAATNEDKIFQREPSQLVDNQLTERLRVII